MIISLVFLIIFEGVHFSNQAGTENQKFVEQVTREIEKKSKRYTNGSYGFRVSETTLKEPLIRTFYFYRKNGSGIVVSRNLEFEKREAYNSRYGFKISRKDEASSWRMGKLCARQETFDSINDSIYSSPDCFFDIVPIVDVLNHPTFFVKSIDLVNDLHNVSFKCKVENAADYILRGGHFLVNSDWDIESYEIDLLYAGTATRAIGKINRDREGCTKLVVTFIIDESVGYEKTVERVSEKCDFGTSPFSISTYGFPEPPFQASRWIPILAFLILAVVGLGLVYYAKTRLASKKS